MSFYDDAGLMLLAGGAAGKGGNGEGTIYNVKPDGALGSETIINGTFDTDSDWVEGSGWSISGGVASCDGTQTAGTNLHNAAGNGLVKGKTYRVEYTITSYSAGSIRVKAGNTGYGVYRSAAGTYVENLVASGSPFTFPTVQFNADSSFVGSIDNVSCKEMDVADFTLNRGADLGATRIGKDGLLEKGNTQLLYNTVWDGITASNSNDSGTGWTKATTQNGSSTATNSQGQITFSAPTTSDRRYLVSPQVSVLSIYAQSVSVDAVSGQVKVKEIMRSNSSSNTTKIATLEDGVVVAGESYVSAGKRYTLIYSLDSTTTHFRFGIGTNPVAETNVSVTLSKPQVEYGMSASSYVENTSKTASKNFGVLVDEPRFDYTGGGCPKLLIEPQRVNEVKDSEYLHGDSANWFEGRVDMTSNQTKSPEGILNASKMTATVQATANTKRLYSNTWDVADDETWTASVFVKAGTANKIELRITSGTEAEIGFGQARFTLSGDGTSEWDDNNAGDRLSITKLENGWYRCTATGTLDSSLTGWNDVARVFIYMMQPGTGSRSWASDGTENLFVYGAQAEEGETATSYIPTYGAAAVTRDVDNITNLDVPDADTDTYTIFFHETTDPAGTGNRGPRFSNSANSSNMGYYTSAGSKIFFCWTNTGESVKAFTNYNAGALSEAKYAFVINNTDSTARLFVNGSLVKVATTTVDVEANRITHGTGVGASNEIQQIIYFPSELSFIDAEILTEDSSYNSFEEAATKLNYTIYE